MSHLQKQLQYFCAIIHVLCGSVCYLPTCNRLIILLLVWWWCSGLLELAHLYPLQFDPGRGGRCSRNDPGPGRGCSKRRRGRGGAWVQWWGTRWWGRQWLWVWWGGWGGVSWPSPRRQWLWWTEHGRAWGWRPPVSGWRKQPFQLPAPYRCKLVGGLC